MNMKKRCFPFFILLLLFIGCKQKVSNKGLITYEKISGDTLCVVDLHAVSDTITLDLFSFMSSPKLVKLEQPDGPTIDVYQNTQSNTEVYVGKDYILSCTMQEFALHDKDGKFIRILATGGRNADQYSSNFSYWVDDRNAVLYIYELDSREILSYDMETGNFLKQLPILLPEGCRQVLPLNDSSFVVFSEPAPLQYKLHLLSASGQYRDSLQLTLSPDKDYDRQIQYGYKFGDRVKFLAASSQSYDITDFTLKPEWKLKYREDERAKIITENDQYLFCALQKRFKEGGAGIEDSTPVSYNPVTYLIDKKTGEGHLLKEVYNNALEHEMNPPCLGLDIVFQPNGYVVRNYNASAFKMRLYITLANGQNESGKRLEPERRSYLEQLQASTHDGDRNIVLFGEFR